MIQSLTSSSFTTADCIVPPISTSEPLEFPVISSLSLLQKKRYFSLKIECKPVTNRNKAYPCCRLGRIELSYEQATARDVPVASSSSKKFTPTSFQNNINTKA